MRTPAVIAALAPLALAQPVARFAAVGSGYVEQGVPVVALPAERAARLTIPGAEALVEPQPAGPDGKVRWLRVSLRASAGRQYEIRESLPAKAPGLEVSQSGSRISVKGDGYEAEFESPDRMRLRAGGATLFDGPVRMQLYPDARSIINAGGSTTVLAPFEPAGFKLERHGGSRAEAVLRGRSPKQKAYNHVGGNNDPKLGFEAEIRFQFSALNRDIRFDWRITNHCGYKSWLERYVLVLPAAKGARPEVTAPFAADLGEGAGVRFTEAGLLHGGIDMPPDGGFGRTVPEIRRLFYPGMSRTFEGEIVLSPRTGPKPFLKLDPQHYSDTGALPERGDPVTMGEWASAVERAAAWLRDHQWRGTLWWGEWWREWDLTRKQGSEEASNGNSALAPLYHFYRTGGRAFLDTAARSAWYTFDVQQSKRRDGFGPMMHTRRHMLDELDWIHPRYQRTGGAVEVSQVMLMDRERREIIETLRSFITRIQTEDGVPHDWDAKANRRGPGETGVDTANIVESLVQAWIETADPFFLDRARGYARWTVDKWKTRKDGKFWNWNLTRYVLNGMLAICRAGREFPGRIPETGEFCGTAVEISRHTISHPELASVEGTIGGGELHYVFYHAWLGAEASRIAKDPKMIAPLLAKAKEQLARQAPDGTFPMEMGSLWSQYPNRTISYYDPKAVAAYLPVLAARLASMR